MPEEKADEALEEMSANVANTYEKLTAQEDEFHKKSMQNLLAKAISQLSPIDDIELILKFGADANGLVERGMRPIHYAAYVNNLDAVNLLLKYGCEVNPKDFTGFTPVHLCADKGHTDFLLLLIENGAEVKVGTSYKEPEEKKENEGAQMNDTDNDNLNMGVAENNEGVAEAENNEGVAEAENNEGVAEAENNEGVAGAGAGDNDGVAEAGENEGVAEAGENEGVAEAGENEGVAEAGDYEGVAVAGNVEDVAVAGNVESVAVEENIEGAVNEEERGNVDSDVEPERIPEEILNDLSVEPLTLALEKNYIEIVKILLKKGADPNRRYFGGYEINLMPLQYVECLEILLDYGANPNTVNRRGMTPLMVAAKDNEPRALRLLLSKGANIDQQRHARFEQKTALHIALESGNRGIVRTLCLQNATVSKLPNYKYNALHTAILTDRVDLVEMIMLFPVDIEEVTEDNCTALMMACASTELKNQKQIIHKLLQYGANPNSHSDIVNYSAPYLSPLAEYLDNQPIPDYDIIIKLIQYGAKVHFSRRTSIARQKDPFGMLPYIPIVMGNPDIWNLLIEACSYFDANALSVCMHFNKEEQEMYTSFGQKPLSLKHQVRLSIRQVLQRPVIEKILKLPLPVFLLKYLVFLTT